MLIYILLYPPTDRKQRDERYVWWFDTSLPYPLSSNHMNQEQNTIELEQKLFYNHSAEMAITSFFI